MGIEWVRPNYYGRFSITPPRTLLYSLSQHAENGVLIASRDKVVKRIYFKYGNPILADSNLSRESLVRYLLNQNPEFLNKFESLQVDKAQFETILLSEKMLDPSQLTNLVQQKTRKILIELIRWKDGDYVFLFDEKPNEKRIFNGMPINIEPVILEGLENLSLPELRQIMDHWFDLTPEITKKLNDFASHLNLSHQHKRLLSRIDSKTTLEDLLFTSWLPLNKSLSFFLLLETMSIISFHQESEIKQPSEAPSNPNLNLEEMEFLSTIRKDGPEMLQMKPFELLGIPRTGFNEEILRRAYYSLAKKYHQRDIVDKLPATDKELSYQIFNRASEVFEALVVWEKRRVEDNFEPFKIESELLDAIYEKLIQSEVSFFKANELYKKSETKRACTFFEIADDTFPNQGEYQCHIANCMICNAEKDKTLLRKTLQTLRRAVYSDSLYIPIYLNMWKVYSLLEESTGAKETLQHLLSIADEDAEVIAAKASLAGDVEENIAHEDEDKEEKKDIEKMILESYERIKDKDYFDVLGVNRNADNNEIRRAYFKLAKQFHPDCLNPSLKKSKIALDLFNTITMAYEILSDPKERKIYERTFRAKEDRNQLEQAEKQAKDERAFNRSVTLINESQYSQAIEILSELNDKHPNQARILSHLSFAEFLREYKSNPKIRSKAEATIYKALEISPKYEQAYVFLGRIAQKMDEIAKAKSFFNKALEINQNNVDAIREIRLINLRIQSGKIKSHEKQEEPAQKQDEKRKKSEEKKPGLFGSFFGKRKQ